MLRHIIPRHGEPRSTTAATSGYVSPEELRDAALFSRLATRTPVEMVPPTKKTVIRLEDVDQATAKVRPDFKQRQEAEKAARRAPGQTYAGIVGHDVRPD